MFESSTINIVLLVAVLVLLSGGIVLVKRSRATKSESVAPQTTATPATDAPVSSQTTTTPSSTAPDRYVDDEGSSSDTTGPAAELVGEEDVEPASVKEKAGRTRSLFASAFQSIRGRGSIDAGTWEEIEETLDMPLEATSIDGVFVEY